jgi:hypothetical protein
MKQPTEAHDTECEGRIIDEPQTVYMFIFCGNILEEYEASSETCFFKKLDNGPSPKKEDCFT